MSESASFGELIRQVLVELSFGDATLFEALVVILLAITALYARSASRANKRLARATEKQAEQSVRPYVTVTIGERPGSPVILMTITNTGKMPAEKLRMELDKDFFQYGETAPETNLRTMNAFSQEIDSLAPGQKLVFHLGSGASIFADEADADRVPQQFSVTATYTSQSERYQERTPIDLRALFRASVEAVPGQAELRDIARNVQRLDETLSAPEE